MHKKILIIGSLFLNFMTPVQAVEEPYVLSQTIMSEVISKERSIELIRQGYVMQEEQANYVSELEEELHTLQERHERLKQQIIHLKEDSDESLYAVQNELNFILENLYEEYFESDEDFHTYSESEQIEILREDPLYIE